MLGLRSGLALAGITVLFSAPAFADRTEDREAIEALMWRYARALDTWNAEAYAAVYTEDGQFGAGENATQGRDALKGMIAAFTSGDNPPPRLLHMTTDSWIEFIDDTHARHHSYWLTMRLGAEGNPPGVAAAGVGVDELVKVDGEWLIRLRNVNAGD